jgi:oxygen-dependent protoporphyrinogen oxidase
MSTPDVEVLVVGAGIAGLAAARDLAAAGVRPLVVDANPRPGGVMQTVVVDGYRMEAGPNTFQARAPLCAFADRHGLWPVLALAAPESRRRSLFQNGRLVDLPRGPWSAVSTPLISTGAKLRMLAEPFIRRGDPTGESVHDFVARRLGAEVATKLVGAFLTGVYAGDERELGIEAVFPALAELERSHGSLVRGGLAGALRSRDPGARGRRGTWSSPDGLGVLAERLASGLPEPVRTEVPVRGLARDAGGWHADLGDGAVHARQIVIATPAYAAADLLAPVDAGVGELLSGIAYAPIVSLGFGVRPADVRGSVEGFGFIAPRSSGLKLLGCLFMSRLFPGRAPKGHELLHVMMGGVRWPESVELPDDVVVAQALADLDRTLGLAGEPRPVAVRRWKRAIPQPGREHVRRIADVARRVDDLPGLHLAGSYLSGVSVADSLASGVRAASRVLQSAV